MKAKAKQMVTAMIPSRTIDPFDYDHHDEESWTTLMLEKYYNSKVSFINDFTKRR